MILDGDRVPDCRALSCQFSCQLHFSPFVPKNKPRREARSRLVIVVEMGDEDIPGLLVGNTTPEERQVITGWLHDALSQTKAEGSAGYSRQCYEAFLAALEQVDRS